MSKACYRNNWTTFPVWRIILQGHIYTDFWKHGCSLYCSLLLPFHRAKDCEAGGLQKDACVKLYWVLAAVACLYLIVFQISGVVLHLCQRVCRLVVPILSGAKPHVRTLAVSHASLEWAPTGSWLGVLVCCLRMYACTCFSMGSVSKYSLVC